MGIPYAEVIGDPIAHSKSPLIHKFWLERLGIDGDYRAIRVTADELPAYFESRRIDSDWRGCNVTMPLKEAVPRMIDRRRDANVDAVNCVVPRDGELVGYNTDMFGVTDCLDRIDTALPICVIGAGGAASAALAGLDLLVVFRFNVIARDPRRGKGLLARFGMEGKAAGFERAEEAMKGAGGVINATPLGMSGAAPMPASVLRGMAGIKRGGFAFDMVYDPLRTEFLDVAARHRLKLIDGLQMLVGQASGAFELLFGTMPPREQDAELRELLTS